MARFVAGAVFGAALMLVAGAAIGLHAQDPKTDVETAARAAGVDPVDLAGAANTVGVDPWVYARSEGLLESAVTSEKSRPPVVAASPPVLPAVSARSVWDRLASCESTNNWGSTSNPIYKGGLQFDAATWARYGGLDFAWRADFASREQQIIVAERVLRGQGWQAWPACSRALGLR